MTSTMAARPGVRSRHLDKRSVGVALGVLTLPLGSGLTLAFVLLAAGFGYLRWARYHRMLRYHRSILAVIALMIVAAATAAAFHGDVDVLLDDAKRLVVIIGLFHLGIGLGREDTRRLFVVLSWACFAAAVMAVVRVGSVAFLSLTYKTSLQAVIGPNELGGLAAMAVLGILTSSSRQEGDMRHVLPGAVALMLSTSRTAIALLLLVLLGAILVRRIPRAVGQIWVAARLILLLGLSVAVLDLYATFASEQQGQDTLRGRSAIWRAAIETVSESFPVGLGSEAAAELAKRSTVDVAYLADTAGRFHSVFLDLIVQYGVMGLALGFGTIYLLAGKFARTALARDRSVFLVVVVFGGARALFESGGWLLSNEVSLATAVCWVLLGSIAIRSSSPEPRLEGRRRSARVSPQASGAASWT